MKFDLFDSIARIAPIYVSFLFSLCFHEYAHGWVARLRGDRTAEIMGRLTMNPLVHMDPIGTFLFPILGLITNFPVIGWAKPVPVEPRNLKNPRTDMFWVALAGPASNMLLALLGSFIFVVIVKDFRTLENFEAWNEILQTFIFINLFLAIFNLIPIHPLDGGKIVERFLSTSLNIKLHQHQGALNILLMVLFFSGAIKYVIIPPAELFFHLMVNLASMVIP